MESEWYLNTVEFKKNWTVACVFLYLLMKNCEELHKSMAETHIGSNIEILELKHKKNL